MRFNFNLNQNKSSQSIYLITFLALASSVLLTHKLWLSDRTFPLAPLFDFFPIIKNPYDIILLYLGAVILALCIIYDFNRKLNIAFTGILILLFLFDMNRLQPWYYFYILIFLAFCFKKSEENTTIELSIIKITLTGSILWNGINKLSPYYFNDAIPWFVSPFEDFYFNRFLMYLAFVIPFLEIISPILIWKSKTRKLGIGLIITIHLFYLFVTSKYGQQASPVMWIWHSYIIGLIFLAFNKHINFKDNINFRIINPKSIGLILLIGIFPLLNLFNLWDTFLSFNLYSGSSAHAKIYLSEEITKYIPEKTYYYYHDRSLPNVVDVRKWAVKELGVSVYPEKRVNEAVKDYFLKYTVDTNQVVFVFNPKKTLFIDSEPIIE